MVATRNELLKPATRRFRIITLPVSGLEVRIRSLMEGEKERFEAETLSKQGGVRQEKIVDARRRLIVACVVDEAGDPILSGADLDGLKQLDGADMAHLQEECMVHCGFKSGDIEGLVKNSEAVHVDDSPTP